MAISDNSDAAITVKSEIRHNVLSHLSIQGNSFYNLRVSENDAFNVSDNNIFVNLLNVQHDFSLSGKYTNNLEKVAGFERPRK